MALKRYRQRHVTQYDGSRYERANCTPATGANGVRAATGGLLKPTGASLRALVARHEETNPATPGWSLEDLDRAVERLARRNPKVSIGFGIRSGDGWKALVGHHDAGYYLAVQGDSDRFPNGTCSGVFDGDHCIGVHPNETASGLWRIDDPICKTSRLVSPAIIRAYAEKLDVRIRYGIFSPRPPVIS